jgi:hypothetical protein
LSLQRQKQKQRKNQVDDSHEPTVMDERLCCN